MRRQRPEAVLLDRDGTINVKAPAGEYITRPEQLELLPGTGEAIRALNAAAVPVIVVTNQRGIALGRMSEFDLAAVHSRLRTLLHGHDARLSAIFHCPHDVGVCSCRKPGTLLLERARRHLGLGSLRCSVMIGDSAGDILAGQAVGARTIMLAAGAGANDDFGDDCRAAGFETAASLPAAVAVALGDPHVAASLPLPGRPSR
jgi:D-glycero-D-manno-heptose 1,7-bisphosphate phosphatase